MAAQCKLTLQEGDQAPAFSAPDQQGKTISLDQFRGRHVLLYFYPKDDTPGCTKEACGFRDSWSDLKKQGVVVIGISPDNEASHRKFIDKYQLPFLLLCDTDRKVMEKYGAYGEKMMYGKPVTGVIRSTVWVGAPWPMWGEVTYATRTPGARVSSKTSSLLRMMAGIVLRSSRRLSSRSASQRS
mgnify:CR=1 FL=1